MSMLGVISFTAPYLPWVMLGFGFLVGNPIDMSLVGILVGHAYYFLEYVYPVVADVRGWKTKRIFVPPRLLKYLCGDYVDENGHGGDVRVHADVQIQGRHLHED